MYIHSVDYVIISLCSCIVYFVIYITINKFYRKKDSMKEYLRGGVTNSALVFACIMAVLYWWGGSSKNSQNAAQSRRQLQMMAEASYSPKFIKKLVYDVCAEYI